MVAVSMISAPLMKAEDAGADRREGDALETVPIRAPARSKWRIAELLVFVAFAHPRPDRVDDVLALSLPPVVMTAPPTKVPPIRSHSSWMRGPPFLRIAPATPPPRTSWALAALTIASVSISVMSPCTSRYDLHVPLHASILYG
jgi:hypothetical protein